MGAMRRIDASSLKQNMMFTAPVYFEDGKNMFLAEGKAVKAYHMAAIKRWNVSSLLTAGQAFEQTEGSNIEQMAGFDKKRLAAQNAAQANGGFEAIEDLEEI